MSDTNFSNIALSPEDSSQDPSQNSPIVQEKNGSNKRDSEQLKKVLKVFAIVIVLIFFFLLFGALVGTGVALSTLHDRNSSETNPSIDQPAQNQTADITFGSIRKTAPVAARSSHNLRNLQVSPIFGDVFGRVVTLTRMESMDGAALYIEMVGNMPNIDYSKAVVSLSASYVFNGTTGSIESTTVTEALECQQYQNMKFLECFLPPMLNVKNAKLSFEYDGKTIDQTSNAIAGKLSYTSGSEVHRIVSIQESQFDYQKAMEELARSLSLELDDINIVAITSSNGFVSVNFELINSKGMTDNDIQLALLKESNYFDPKSTLASSSFCDPCSGECKFLSS